MSTEINIEKLYENCIKILTDLIGFKTISGDDNSNLIAKKIKLKEWNFTKSSALSKFSKEIRKYVNKN